jgi:hypothetical protein
MIGNVNLGLVRRMWQTLEPLHALLYYAPEVSAEAEKLGYQTEERWPSYFAWRAAPLGTASAELVAATFYSFSPRMVEQYIPDAWRIAEPEVVLEARLCAVDGMYRSVLGERLGTPELAEAAGLARSVAEAAENAGRPLAAANAALSWADEPHLVLWQAVTRIREHRGDGHVAALLTHGLDPVESLVSHSAAGAAPAEVFTSRRWADEEWRAARERLMSRGWVDTEGVATEKGQEGRAAVERLTDELAESPWRAIGAEKAVRLADLALPAVFDVIGTGLLPMSSTLGIGMTYPHQEG